MMLLADFTLLKGSLSAAIKPGHSCLTTPPICMIDGTWPTLDTLVAHAHTVVGQHAAAHHAHLHNHAAHHIHLHNHTLHKVREQMCSHLVSQHLHADLLAEN